MTIQKFPLKQIVQISQGISLSRYKDETGEIEKLIVNTRNLDHLYTSGDLEQVRLSVSDVERYQLQVNDVVIANRGIPLKASVVTEQVVGSLAGQNLAVLRPKVELDPIYLAAVLRSQWMEQSLTGLYSASVGTTLISIAELSNIKFPLPELETQQKIAQLFLSAERATQATLEALETRQKLIEFALSQTLEAHQ